MVKAIAASEGEVQRELANLIKDVKACLQSFVVWDYKHVLLVITLLPTT